jgi:sugar lactone lactonase YvrE
MRTKSALLPVAAVIALAASSPIASSLAQSLAPAPAAQAGDGQPAQIRQGVPAGDYNVSARASADEALPNLYARDETFFKFPTGRKLGSTSAIDIDKDGKSIWIMERCGGQDYCFGPNAHVAPIMKFDSKGNFVKAFGADTVVYPHGLHIDQDGNIWISDLASNVDWSSLRNHTAPPNAPVSPKPNGADVLKFSPDGKLLMRLGTPGVYGNDEIHLSQPSAVATAANGDIFVADGHDTPPSNSRIVKYDKNGKFLKAWSSCGNNPASMLDCGHALAMDSQGRLFVGNRGNNRIEIFDQDGNLLAEWTQFGKPSGLFIDKNDTLYVADSESSVRNRNSYVRGIHIGSAKTGEVKSFSPDPGNNPAPWNPLRGTTGSEGLAVDKDGILYASSVTPPNLAKYVLRTW